MLDSGASQVIGFEMRTNECKVFAIPFTACGYATDKRYRLTQRCGWAAYAGVPTRRIATAPGKYNKRELQWLLYLLEWPIIDQDTREVVLRRLEMESGQDFQGSVSAAARWGRAMGLDVSGSPRRSLP
jgi:hypothetical protein